MCGRFTLITDPAQLQIAFPWVSFPNAMQNIPPRYNIAPSQPVAVIPNTPPHLPDFFTWGLVPSWAKDPQIGYRLINARAETLARKPSFRNAYRRRRCLILADGFYEWKAGTNPRQKTPYFIHMKDKSPFAIAGLWEIWQSADGSEIKSCTIITTQPNSLLKPIHNRMPVILKKQDYPVWLSPDEQPPENIQPLLAPYPADKMIAYPVSRRVNNPTNDSPECIQPEKQVT